MKVQEELKKLVKRTDIWREGEYLDLWSVPHFLSGALLACFIYLLHINFFYSIILATILLTAYEIFEIKIGIWETDWNRRLDVIVGLTSFIPTILLISDWDFLEVFVFGLFLSVIDGTLSFIGWSASHKAMLLENKIKKEYEILKNKFLQKMKERKEKRAEKIAEKLALIQLKKKQKLGMLE